MTKHIVIIRLSALGDVAIAAPLVRAYAEANPKVTFTMVSQPKMESLFGGIPNLHFMPYAKSKNDIVKSIKFAGSIARLKPTAVADIHNVLRSKLMRLRLSLSGIESHSLDKNRSARRALTREKNKVLVPLRSSMRGYEEVLVKCGLADLHFTERPLPPRKAGNSLVRRIGIAPFAAHKGKAWPVEYMERVVEHLSKDENVKVYLFGGGASEKEILAGWESRFKGVESLCGKVSLSQEIEFMRTLDLMVTMDSANMHFASFAEVPVVSVWGATHPYAGFYGWGQKPGNALQRELPCRPCSIFGNKPCAKENYECLYGIKPEEVLGKIYELL